MGDVSPHPSLISCLSDNFCQRPISLKFDLHGLVFFEQRGKQGGAGERSAKSDGGGWANVMPAAGHVDAVGGYTGDGKKISGFFNNSNKPVFHG